MAERLSLPRPLLLVLAVLFAAATTLYSALWMYYVRRPPQVGIGIHFTYSIVSHSILVTDVDKGTSAQRAGLRPGDRVVAINGTRLSRLTPYFDDVARGHPGGLVRLRIVRPGEPSPEDVEVVLQSLTPAAFTLGSTPTRAVALGFMGLYPVLFLVVGFPVLFLRLDDRNAWLLALLFAGFIALPDLQEGAIQPVLREFTMLFRSTFAPIMPAVFYSFFAVFPAPSSLERRAPWLKWAFAAAGLGLTALTLWTVGAAGTTAPSRFPVERFGAHWLTSLLTASAAVYGLGAMGLGLASLTLNSLSSASAEARRKARVIVWGVLGGLLPILLVGGWAALGSRSWVEQIPFWLWAIAVLAMFLLPLSFAYAVVKHRVLEIPVLLRRSARYLLVQRGFLVLILLVSWGAIIVFVLAFSRLFESGVRGAIPAGLGAGVGLGVLLAWAGNQAAQRGTRRIDQAFFRSAYDARQILENLADQTRKAIDREKLAGLLGSESNQALHPTSVIVYMEGRDGQFRVEGDTVPPRYPSLSPQHALLQELAHRGEPWEVPPPRAEAKNLLEGHPVFAALRPECLVPMLGRDGSLRGLIALGPRLSEEPYSREDKRLLASAASQAGVALESMRLAEEMAERLEAERRADYEMEIAKQVQAKLFPQKHPPLSTLQYAGGCVQARQIGGDYYDFLDLGPGRLGIALADIAGKGVSAALLMANLQANLRSQYAVALDDLTRLFQSVNRLFCENTADTSYATLFFADYADATRRLRYVNCGHNPPFLVRKDGRVERLTATATVLGIFEDWESPVAEVHLAAGDSLVIYTDGISEALSDEGEEFGEDRVLETILRYRHLAAPELLEALLATVQQFSGREQEDDLTLVVGCAL
jgi:sigma-B regulation protein RsbU (phosphoserine phosphatase)